MQLIAAIHEASSRDTTGRKYYMKQLLCQDHTYTYIDS